MPHPERASDRLLGSGGWECPFPLRVLDAAEADSRGAEASARLGRDDVQIRPFPLQSGAEAASSAVMSAGVGAEEALHRSLGLTDNEYEMITARLSAMN